MNFEIFITFAIAFISSYFAVPLVNYVGQKYSLVDRPNSRKQHNKPLVRIGGLAILLGIFIPIIITSGIGWLDINSHFQLITIIGSSFLLFSLGFLDDIFTISFSKRLFFQVLVSIIAFSQGIRFTKIDLIFLNPQFEILELPMILSILLTIFWVVGIVNAFNWLDGLDGLASGIAVIASLSLFLASFSIGHYENILFILILLGACQGFLNHNFYPAKIFMGDGGSYLIGGFLSLYSIYIYNSSLESTNNSISFFSILLILFIPLVDMVYVICNRILKGKLPFYPDRGHLHHRLLRAGFNHKDSVYLCYLLSLTTGVVALCNIYPNYSIIFILISSILNLYFLKIHFKKFKYIFEKIYSTFFNL